MIKKCVSEVLQSGKSLLHQELCLSGWVRSFRSRRFIIINDGSCFDNIQAVIDQSLHQEETLNQISTGSSINVVGTLEESQGNQQDYEIQVKKF